MTYQVVYVSSASSPLTRPELDDILTTSRRKNAALGVSGALLYAGGNWMQVLEGEQSAVESLLTSIRRDPRHHGLLVLIRAYQETRQFREWSMAFGDLDLVGDDDAGDYSDFLRRPTASADFGAQPGAAQKLLLSFRRSLVRA
jgi:hypothetical protein